MPNFAYFFVILVRIILFVLEIGMLLRAVLSWFPGTEETALYNFVFLMTEPLIIPVRALFERLNWFTDFPLDISFFVTYILLSIVSMFV